MGNDVRVQEWACVRVSVFVSVSIRGYKYSDCIWVILGHHARPVNSLLSICGIMGVSVSDSLPFVVNKDPNIMSRENGE